MDQMKLRLQRAALMAIVVGVIKAENETPLVQIKTAIASTFGDLIDQGLMIGDEIDVMVAKAIRDFLLAEKAVQDAEEIINAASQN